MTNVKRYQKVGGECGAGGQEGGRGYRDKGAESGDSGGGERG